VLLLLLLLLLLFQHSLPADTVGQLVVTNQPYALAKCDALNLSLLGGGAVQMDPCMQTIVVSTMLPVK
jgi:hypothetical protein